MMEMVTMMMMKKMKDPVNNLAYWTADSFSCQGIL